MKKFEHTISVSEKCVEVFMMENKKKMDDYNWPDLYRQADKFMRHNIYFTADGSRIYGEEEETLK